MTDTLRLSCAVPRWFRLTRWGILLLAVSALLLAPVHDGTRALVIAVVLCASLFSWFRPSRWQSVDWSGDGVLLLHDTRRRVIARAAWTGHAWRSRFLCVVQVRASSGDRHDLVLFSACQASCDWRRLLVRLRTRAGQVDTPQIVF